MYPQIENVDSNKGKQYLHSWKYDDQDATSHKAWSLMGYLPWVVLLFVG
jgi:hypothetical protein